MNRLDATVPDLTVEMEKQRLWNEVIEKLEERIAELEDLAAHQRDHGLSSEDSRGGIRAYMWLGTWMRRGMGDIRQQPNAAVRRRFSSSGQALDTSRSPRLN